MKKKEKEILVLGGNIEESYYVDMDAQVSFRVDPYTAILFHEGNSKPCMVISPETKERMYIVMRKHKVKTVLFSEKEITDQLPDSKEDELSHFEKFQGVMILVYQLKGEQQSYHVILIDARGNTLKNIIFESFSYKEADVFGILNSIFSHPAVHIHQMQQEYNSLLRLMDSESNSDTILEKKNGR